MFFSLENENGLSKRSEGYKCSYKFKFSAEDVQKFSEVTGDNNPIHIDKSYAEGTIFKQPIVHGFYVGSILSRIFGTEYPGTGTIYMSQTMNFLAPVFMDEFYYAEILVSKIHSSKGNALISTKFVDENGSEVLIGEAKIKNEIYSNS